MESMESVDYENRLSGFLKETEKQFRRYFDDMSGEMTQFGMIDKIETHGIFRNHVYSDGRGSYDVIKGLIDFAHAWYAIDKHGLGNWIDQIDVKNIPSIEEIHEFLSRFAPVDLKEKIAKKLKEGDCY